MFQTATALLRIVRYIPILLIFGCSASKTVSSPTSEEAPAGIVLTVIFAINPKLDTLTVFDVIRGSGNLRSDFSATAEAGPEDLLFSYLDANDRILRQTAIPYPVPNRYESPSENGEIVQEVFPDEVRTLVLKTQGSRRLRWLHVNGVSPSNVVIDQRIDLQSKE